MRKLIQFKQGFLFCLWSISLIAMDNSLKNEIVLHIGVDLSGVYKREVMVKRDNIVDKQEIQYNQEPSNKYKEEIKESIGKTILSSNKKSQLVVIRGTANCGKSSLCRKLKTFDSSYIIVSEDDINRKMTYEIYESIFPTEMANICKAIKYENLWRATQYHDLLFEKAIDEQEKIRVTEAILGISKFFKDDEQKSQLMAIKTMRKYSVMQQLLFYAACGQNIIFDAWGVTNWTDELVQLKSCFNRMIGVAAYCSLTTVLQRWNKRNEDAVALQDLTERRTLRQMLTSFFGFFNPALDHKGFVKVTKNEFDTLINNANQYIQNVNDNEILHERSSAGELTLSGEFTLKELFEFKEKMYTKFGFERNDQIIFSPSVSYDILLCTEGDSNSYVQALLKEIRGK